MHPVYPLHPAQHTDIPALSALIADSARDMCAPFYTASQIAGALQGAFGVDTQLIEDGTYFVVRDGAALVGCGGWSFRKTLFGSDDRAERDATRLVAGRDPAKIRAFFVDPAYARRGIGAQILQHSEQAAQEQGFTETELMATLSGVAFYQKHGYRPQSLIWYPLPNGETIQFIPMHKTL